MTRRRGRPRRRARELVAILSRRMTAGGVQQVCMPGDRDRGGRARGALRRLAPLGLLGQDDAATRRRRARPSRTGHATPRAWCWRGGREATGRRPRPGRDGAEPRTGRSVLVMDRLDLVPALCQQIPDVGMHMVRYDGAWCSNYEGDAGSLPGCLASRSSSAPPQVRHAPYRGAVSSRGALPPCAPARETLTGATPVGVTGDAPPKNAPRPHGTGGVELVAATGLEPVRRGPPPGDRPARRCRVFQGGAAPLRSGSGDPHRSYPRRGHWRRTPEERPPSARNGGRRVGSGDWT